MRVENPIAQRDVFDDAAYVVLKTLNQGDKMHQKSFMPYGNKGDSSKSNLLLATLQWHGIYGTHAPDSPDPAFITPFP